MPLIENKSVQFECENLKATGRGGKRAGAGRPKGSKSVNVKPSQKRISVGVRLPRYMVQYLRNRKGSITELIENAIVQTYNPRPPGRK